MRSALPNISSSVWAERLAFSVKLDSRNVIRKTVGLDRLTIQQLLHWLVSQIDRFRFNTLVLERRQSYGDRNQYARLAVAHRDRQPEIGSGLI